MTRLYYLWLTAVLALSAANAEVQNPGSTTRLPEVTISAPPLNEEASVGPNNQPEWTTRRRFATTRVYVIEPWQMEFEQWWRGDFPREGRGHHLFQEEIGIGLPYRFQFDIYENHELTDKGTWRHKGNQFEVRWAFAEWGKIPLNPTLYAEYKVNDEAADVCEFKLLLGEEIAPRWHWGLNVAYEQEIGGNRATELAVSQAVSYTLIDEKLAAGVELKFAATTEKESRGEPAYEFLAGPSLQWRPTPRTHLDLVPLIGITGDSPRVEAFVVFGIDFGPGDDHHAATPVSGRSR